MKKKFIFSVVSMLAFASSALLEPPSYADDKKDDLKREIELLQKRVDELEASQNQGQDDDLLESFTHRNRSWDPFSEMNRIQEEMNRMFQNSYHHGGNIRKGVFSNSMSFDNDFKVQETKDEYEIKFDMKGMDKEKIDIQINEHSVTVKGEHSREETEENKKGYFSSQSFGSFMKTIPLPSDADTSKVKTEKEEDVLIIRMPKRTS